MFAKLLEKVGCLRSPEKELPLNGQTFSEYKVSLIKKRVSCERELRENWVNKVPELNKESLISEIHTIGKLLEPVYELEKARNGTLFPL